MIVAPDIKDGESVNLLLDQKRKELLSMAGDSVELHHSDIASGNTLSCYFYLVLANFIYCL